jgi:hypoxanthine phosphoribosyltransferase
MTEVDPENQAAQAAHKQPVFIHPIEAAFARILDFYGVAWEYEPRSFPLKWDKQGRVIQAFQPDFYLPGQDLYVELTTLRPQLTRRKNSKLKQIKELYPEINIKLFKRRELRNMMLRFGLLDEATRIFGSAAQKQDEED